MSNTPVIPFETTILVRDSCLCLHMQKAARSLARHFDEVLRPFGLTNGQFSLLMALNQPVPPGMGAVAGILGMDRTTLTAALKPLERHGLLEIVQDMADRRSKRLRLMPRGHAVLAAALPAWRNAHAELEQRLTKNQAERLRQDLVALTTLASGEMP
ncbi:MarR family winged helix-turn-helix transcriptional regulator [Beijerinckia mobilis]|uniref:MarR family winged helix-turn-helix transcriptional regulator n=1 Tax=Beijerinckia mobilis TaxID=231434 RepID=UPI000552EE8E|nr:MarR family winged helix-turn-helix transcriptional regulator [Beijerinckia mobilis]